MTIPLPARRWFACLGLLGGLGAGCGGGSDSLPPGDHWFRGVTTGSESGSIDVVMFDPDYKAQRTPGTPGASGMAEVRAVLFTRSGMILLQGTYESSGAFTASGGGFLVKGKAGSHAVRGTYSGPDGEEGDIAGEDSSTGKTARYCGTYDGDASGDWNFVLSERGTVTGSFSGDADGNLSGSASGDSINLSWSGETWLGDPASGTAKGTVAGGGPVVGTWKGSAGGDAVSGDWMSDNSCPGPQAGPEVGTQESCPCDRPIPPGGGGCCTGGPYGSYCCGAIF